MQTFAPRLRTLVLCAAALIAFTASVGTAGAATKPYSATISPASVAAGSTTTLTATLSVPAGAQQQLGAAQLTAPAGVSLVPGSVGYSGPGTAVLTGNLVELNNVSVQPGTSRSFTVQAKVPCSASGTLTWGVRAKQANEFNGGGNALDLVGPAPSTTIAGGACRLQFATQPENARVNETITGTAYSPTSPAVGVEVVDGAGQRVSSTAPITLATKTGPSALQGTTTVSATAGLSSFGTIKLGTPGSYTLEATSPGITSATSDGFKVDTVAVACVENVTCTGTASTPRTKVDVTAFSSSLLLDAGFLTLSFNTGPAIDCAGYQEMSPDTVLLDVTSLARTKTAALTIDKKQMNLTPNNGASSLNFCFGSPVPFLTKSGLISTTQGSYDWDADGVATPVYVGLLPNCSTAPCVTGRKKTGAGDGVITASLPAGDPAMRG